MTKLDTKNTVSHIATNGKVQSITGMVKSITVTIFTILCVCTRMNIIQLYFVQYCSSTRT